MYHMTVSIDAHTIHVFIAENNTDLYFATNEISQIIGKPPNHFARRLKTNGYQDIDVNQIQSIVSPYVAEMENPIPYDIFVDWNAVERYIYCNAEDDQKTRMMHTLRLNIKHASIQQGKLLRNIIPHQYKNTFFRDNEPLIKYAHHHVFKPCIKNLRISDVAVLKNHMSTNGTVFFQLTNATHRKQFLKWCVPDSNIVKSYSKAIVKIDFIMLCAKLVSNSHIRSAMSPLDDIELPPLIGDASTINQRLQSCVLFNTLRIIVGKYVKLSTIQYYNLDMENVSYNMEQQRYEIDVLHHDNTIKPFIVHPHLIVLPNGKLVSIKAHYLFPKMVPKSPSNDDNMQWATTPEMKQFLNQSVQAYFKSNAFRRNVMPRYMKRFIELNRSKLVAQCDKELEEYRIRRKREIDNELDAYQYKRLRKTQNMMDLVGWIYPEMDYL